LNLHVKILKTTRRISSVVFVIGMIIFSLGFVSGFNSAIGIGLGTVTGAMFIFLIGMFFIATEEMVENTFKGIEITPVTRKKGAPNRRPFNIY
jgi:TRAP-type C4-dicarboxylate transport system permease small subunit